ncbi:hypothetical protein HK57_00524 [Aspergillus ustus]|uniref:Uncharacterized protein n=1 Tax=Aspergillus ustus TaxID=40382 RepID=A0A0C1E6H6_ASPUT|nr:hypothetical protein HK57_00524 [Aspergillus ustus]
MCSRVKEISTSWSYPAILAVTKTHPSVLAAGIPNPAPGSTGSGNSDAITGIGWRFDAVEAWSSDTPGVNYFNLSLTSPSSGPVSSSSGAGPPYTVTGTSSYFDQTVLGAVQ